MSKNYHNDRGKQDASSIDLYLATITGSTAVEVYHEIDRRAQDARLKGDDVTFVRSSLVEFAETQGVAHSAAPGHSLPGFLGFCRQYDCFVAGAHKALYEKVLPSLLKYLGNGRHNVPVHSRMDVLHDAMRDLWNKRDKNAWVWNGELGVEKVAANLFQIVKNKAIDFNRRTQSRIPNTSALPFDSSSVDVPDTTFGHQSVCFDSLKGEVRNRLISLLYTLDSVREAVILVRIIVVFPDELPLGDLVNSLTSKEREYFVAKPKEKFLSLSEQRSVIYPRVKSARWHLQRKIDGLRGEIEELLAE